MDKTIVIATNNKGKAKEFKSLFNDYGYKVKTLHDFPEIGEIPETGNTFAENALQKASAISRELNTIVLADDSGLEVEALNNEPGIYSARYAGEHGNDQKNNEKLLKELKNVPKEERKANFHCTLVLVGPGRDPLFVEGNINGFILFSPKGENGFGYDPLFYIPSLEKSMGELTEAEKNKISHRAKAIKQLENHLDKWL
ncbi:MAG TPA: XTP/dITP diphosphatase [Candidatus Atopostipes pullistercoris]|uniref:dITP/XTP pyrophosphatase n=1 Tax=Candidatus Atopostipes pullistercoris TaxID=2838467 RepID=A0A9D2G366_9LACT|nr:XTP/dITP diphosphatase [Candidatus Atopostipes pullistercoris]